MHLQAVVVVAMQLLQVAALLGGACWLLLAAVMQAVWAASQVVLRQLSWLWVAGPPMLHLPGARAQQQQQQGQGTCPPGGLAAAATAGVHTLPAVLRVALPAVTTAAAIATGLGCSSAQAAQLPTCQLEWQLQQPLDKLLQVWEQAQGTW